MSLRDEYIYVVGICLQDWFVMICSFFFVVENTFVN